MTCIEFFFLFISSYFSLLLQPNDMCDSLNSDFNLPLGVTTWLYGSQPVGRPTRCQWLKKKKVCMNLEDVTLDILIEL